jgi:hypothetical protein
MSIDEETSAYILKTVAKARLQTASGELPSVTELRTLLSAAFDQPASPATEGELADAALGLLAEDPEFAEPIRVMASQPVTAASRQRYLEPGAIAVTTAALLVLQTRVKFKRDHTGKWSIEMDKKAASDSALKPLIQRLLSWLPK